MQKKAHRPKPRRPNHPKCPPVIKQWMRWISVRCALIQKSSARQVVVARCLAERSQSGKPRQAGADAIRDHAAAALPAPPKKLH